MAWITKQSRTADVPKAERGFLTEAMRAELRERYLPRYETTLAAVMPALHMVQHAYGWVPPAAQLEIAEFLDLRPSQVADTVSFYEEYWTKPKGKHLVSVCRSISCEACGHAHLTEAVCRHLDIEVGETTDDGEFTLVELECIGACGGAPAALVDETLHEHLTPEGLIEALEAKRGEKAGEHH